MREKLHEMHFVRRTDLSLEQIARRINPIVRGWIQYYGHYHPWVLHKVLEHLNWLLAQWARRKYKPLKQHQRQAGHWLGRIARRQPGLFAHWQAGILL